MLDPYGGSVDPSNPRSWNRYGYAGNDPPNGADPTGLLFTAQDCISNPDACVADDQGWGPLGSPGPDGLPCGFGYGTVCGIIDPGYGSIGPPGVCSDMPSGSPFAPGTPTPGPTPCPTPTPPAQWQMYVVATADCYRPFVGKPGVWERDVTYVADMVSSTGQTTQLTGDGSTTIRENLSYISGQKPPASSSSPGSPFFDQISVGNGGSFVLTQTFTVTYEGVSYAAQIQSAAGTVSANRISATQKYVDINGNPNLGSRGSHPLCD